MTKLVLRATAPSALTANGADSSGSQLTHDELDKNFFPLANITDGTVSASKAVVVDSSKDIAGFNDVTIGGTTSTVGLTLNSVSVTATGTELNILDGVTSTTAELNILDGVTATAADINQIASPVFFGGNVAADGTTINSTYGETWAVARPSTGVYRITPGTAVSDANDWIVTATSDSPAAANFCQVMNKTTTTFDVQVHQRSDGTLNNDAFCFQCIVGS